MFGFRTTTGNKPAIFMGCGHYQVYPIHYQVYPIHLDQNQVVLSRSKKTHAANGALSRKKTFENKRA